MQQKQQLSGQLSCFRVCLYCILSHSHSNFEFSHPHLPEDHLSNQILLQENNKQIQVGFLQKNATRTNVTITKTKWVLFQSKQVSLDNAVTYFFLVLCFKSSRGMNIGIGKVVNKIEHATNLSLATCSSAIKDDSTADDYIIEKQTIRRIMTKQTICFVKTRNRKLIQNTQNTTKQDTAKSNQQNKITKLYPTSCIGYVTCENQLFKLN